MRRVQLSFDLLAISLFVFMIFLAMFEVYASESYSSRIRESMLSATRVANIVARAINEVCKQNGTNTTAVIPESLDTGDSYYLSVKASGRRVDVFWPISSQNRSIGVPIMTNQVSGNVNISKTAGSGSSTLNISNIGDSINIG